MNFRDFCKKSVTKGLESDSGYSSDYDSSAVEIIGSASPEKNSRTYSSERNTSNSDVMEIGDDKMFKNCSPKAAQLLKTGIIYDNQIKRILAIWPQLHS